MFDQVGWWASLCRGFGVALLMTESKTVLALFHLRLCVFSLSCCLEKGILWSLFSSGTSVDCSPALLFFFFPDSYFLSL